MEEKRVGIDAVVGLFSKKWSDKYKAKFKQPSQEDIKDLSNAVYEAQSLGHSTEAIKDAMEAFLEDTFEGYVENGHPLRFFTKGLMRFIFKGRSIAEKKRLIEQAEADAEEKRELLDKYGIMKMRDTYLTDDGKAYVSKAYAIAAAEKSAKIKALKQKKGE